MTDLELEAQYFKDSLFALSKDVAVRVEGTKNDELFWSTIFQIAVPDIKPEFYPQCVQYPSAGTTGKNCVLLLKDYADKELVLCIDSDSDYLLENPILQTPFVFHTYADSIENFWCYAKGLSEVMKTATNTEGVPFDFVNFFKNYSSILYPYLLCSLFSTKEKDNLLARQELGKHAGFIKITDITADLTVLKEKLENQYTALLNSYKANTAFEPFKQHLTDLGLIEKEAYLFVRGHDVLDRVFVPLMKFIGDDLTKTHFTSLTTNEEKANYYAHIKAHNYDFVAQNNSFMHTSVFYQRIVEDIQATFQN
jgi:Protein of unknown function (DUF4435)